MLLKFAKALLRWCRSRRPLAPRVVIDIRYSYCRRCPLLRQSWWRRYCAGCGCTINQIRWPLNKLAVPTEECPVGRWGRG